MITSYTWNFLNFTCVITILVKFDIHFLGLPREIFFSVLTDIDDWLYLKPLKNVKKNAIFFKLFWYKVFLPWKLKLFNFLVDSVLTANMLFVFNLLMKSFHSNKKPNSEIVTWLMTSLPKMWHGKILYGKCYLVVVFYV